MPKGPGKYDRFLTQVKDETGTINAALIISDGNLGSGFSVQGTGDFLLRLPAILRNIADQVEKDNAEGFDNETIIS